MKKSRIVITYREHDAITSSTMFAKTGVKTDVWDDAEFEEFLDDIRISKNKTKCIYFKRDIVKYNTTPIDWCWEGLWKK